MAFYKTPTLETERLILRPVTIDDATDVQRLFPHWEIVKYMNDKVPWPYPDDGAYDFYTNVLLPAVAEGRTIVWALVEKASVNFMGVLQISPKDGKESRGLWIGSAFQKHGYITEAVVATTDYVFNELGIKQLIISNAVENVSSSRLKVKANAELIEIFESRHVCGVLPSERWRLTPERWAASPMKRTAANSSYKIIS